MYMNGPTITVRQSSNLGGILVGIELGAYETAVWVSESVDLIIDQMLPHALERAAQKCYVH
jgi:2-keto-3-deoxy-galactonokinase